MTSKEKVLRVWPDARCYCWFVNGFGRPTDQDYKIYADASGSGSTEAEAWDDAASKLPSAPSPAPGPLNAADQSAVDAGCNCSRKMPYYDWNHAKTCPLYVALPEPVSTEGATAKPKCVDCRDHEANIRKWIAQLGGTPDVRHISLELERLVDRVAAPIAPAAVSETEIDPCPWCGSEPEETHANDRSYYYVGCSNEQCPVQPETGLCVDRAAARKEWNWKPLAAKPSAEGDGWIANMRPAVITSDGGVVEGIFTTYDAALAWAKQHQMGVQNVRGGVPFHDVQFPLPAPPSGQGEKR